MDFHQLLTKMQELDQPVPETQDIIEPTEGNEFSGALAKAKAAGEKEFEVDGKKYQIKEDGTVEECPMSPMSASPESSEPPPSMSLNLNAQGMDNIEQLMKLVTKVNPDMDKPAMPPMPTMGMDPTIASIKPSMPPLKMLPDLDKEEATDTDSDEDDIMTHLNKKLKPFDDEQTKDKEEAFANSAGDSEPEVGDIEDLIRDGNDLHKKKSMHKAAAGGDNAMAAESTDLRSQIRAELLRRLEEAKGAK